VRMCGAEEAEGAGRLLAQAWFALTNITWACVTVRGRFSWADGS